jgi:hypothetical protein
MEKISLLKTIPESIVEVDFPINDKILQLQVDQNSLTEKFIKEFDAMSGTSNIEGMGFALSKLIRSWNNSDSEPTHEYFASLPFSVSSEIFGAVMEAIVPKKTIAGTSGDITSQAAA